jgi:hypothetical protein
MRRRIDPLMFLAGLATFCIAMVTALELAGTGAFGPAAATAMAERLAFVG